MKFITHNKTRTCPVTSSEYVVLRNIILVCADPYETRAIYSVPVKACHIENWPKVQDYAVVTLSYDGLKLAQPVEVRN